MSQIHLHIIVGAGIAGLYAAYKLHQKNTPYLILEASNKANIGGRMGSPLFHGTRVAKGAGVGRKRKDHRLIRLLDELKVPYTEFRAEHHYADTIDPPCNVKETFLYIKDAYEEQHEEANFLTKNNEETTGPKGRRGIAGFPQVPGFPANKTFREFAEPLLGKERYRHFTMCAGYTDYENEAVESTLYDYGFDDNYAKWTGLSIPWNILLDRLLDVVGRENIHANTKVTRIEQTDQNTYVLSTEKGKVYPAGHVILATTITSLRKLLPAVPEYRFIQSQPFLRVYGKFSSSSAKLLQETLQGLTVVPGPLHKIIPMDMDKGIYMIVYTDNKGATLLHKHKDDLTYLSRQVERAIGLPRDSLTLLSTVDFYWEDGTHYYVPLPHTTGEGRSSRNAFIKKVQHPYPNITVVGEVVSRNQGWVEGALESVDKGGRAFK